MLSGRNNNQSHIDLIVQTMGCMTMVRSSSVCVAPTCPEQLCLTASVMKLQFTALYPLNGMCC